MKKTKHILPAMILFAVLLLSLGMNAFAGMTKGQALNIAKTAVKSPWKLVKSEHDKEDQKWEFKYYTKDKKAEYEITVDEKTGRISQIEMEKLSSRGGKRVSISKKEAGSIVRKLFKGAKILHVKKEKDHDLYEYEVRFETKKFRGEVELNAQNGKVLEWTKVFII